ncbi:hNH endonuclease [Escherichia coli]|uniref:hNH endonuclease n=1 Tax=Escherichia coli TaxID=562 RepID=UPI00216A1662|nr:hNH endonuclease [Escherichia coli]
MKQMSLIEMDGFLKGKCIPSDLKVSETNAEYLVRKFGELESKLETALRECRSAGITIDNLEDKCSALAAENAMLKQRTQQLIDIISNTDNDYCMCGSAMKDHVHSGCGYPTGMFDYYYNQWLESDNKTPATDAFLAEVRASAIPDEATERDLFEEWVMEKIFISKTTLEGLRTDDGYRNSTLSGTDYNGMWSQWKAIRAAQLRQEAAQ